ncbi:TPA: hypothetical protein EYN98_20665 [Candidatus Poribacteria bacterium]|nr:hypothetical protein [Candidatus Poribacteria bacterium]HIN27427.1 hypothetical protein [Candidatus Poribacteria bacterium]HIP08768.1 hypothetical protein [Rhodospirillales bacterium]
MNCGRQLLDLSQLNLDGTHSLAKKGREAVAYQGRKKAEISNIFSLTDAHGDVIASTEVIAGNHNDAFELADNLDQIFSSIKQLGLPIIGPILTLDSAFDTLACRRICFNRHLIPNISENKRHRKGHKRGRPRLFEAAI